MWAVSDNFVVMAVTRRNCRVPFAGDQAPLASGSAHRNNNGREYREVMERG